MTSATRSDSSTASIRAARCISRTPSTKRTTNSRISARIARNGCAQTADVGAALAQNARVGERDLPLRPADVDDEPAVGAEPNRLGLERLRFAVGEDAI